MATGVLVLFAALLPLLLAANGGDSTAVNTLPGCQAECGSVSIPYPFGIGTDGNGKDCFAQADFNITCNDTTPPPEAYLSRSNNAVVTNISVLHGEVRLLGYVSVGCYLPDASNIKKTVPSMVSSTTLLDLSGLAFTFSATRNKFTVLGCDTVAFITGNGGVFYTAGCTCYCDDTTGMAMANGTCSGLGCCQTSIPKGLSICNATVQSLNSHQNGWGVRQDCGYAFLVAEDEFQFQIPDLYLEEPWLRRFPVVLDWSLGKSSCGPDLQKSPEYACRSKNSECVNSSRDVGYVCNCSRGYEGNPYLENGCQDINECEQPKLYPCNGRCKNTIGSYKCKNTRLLWVLGGVGLGLLLILLVTFLAIWGLLKRKLKKMKQVIDAYEGSIFRLYSEEELKRATKKVSPNERILDEGSQGTTYKGVLEGNKTVAIKQFNKLDERRRREFVKEIITLSQIDHKNVIKLLGCCLAVEQPMLVYEFIPGGNLSSFIHERDHRGPISLDTRLSIAVDVADALTYLHSYDPTPIFHGDIKSSNILLDENKKAKLSDFTASRLALKDRKHVVTVVQGTYGYLDPEYFQTNQLTEKSDVYSFGVLLVELLTGKDPLVFEGPEEQRSLALHFVSSVTQNRLMGILDAEIARERNVERLRSIAELACQCLKAKGEFRPTMEEVLTALTTIEQVPRAPAGSL